MAINSFKGINSILDVVDTIQSVESTVVYPRGVLVIDSSRNIKLGDGTTAGGLAVAGSSGFGNSSVDSHLNTSTATSGQVLSWTGTDYDWVAQSGGGGGGSLNNIVEDTTPQLGGNLDAQAFDITTTGKILYSNMYAAEGDLPSATTYHGMFAHVHATGAGYFAHGGNWIKLANYTDLSPYQTVGTLGTNIDLHLNQGNPTSGYVLSWDGSDYTWVANSGGLTNTDSLAEGSTNLYYTDARFDARLQTRNLGNMADVDTSGASNGQVLAWSSANSQWEPLTISSGGIALTDLSVTTASAGTAALSYDNTSGVFTYTPPDLSSYLTSVPAQSFASLTGKPTTLAGYGITDAVGSGSTLDTNTIQTSSGNLTISADNYVRIDSDNNGQIEIGTDSGVGDVRIGNEGNGTSIHMEGVTTFEQNVKIETGVQEKFGTLTGQSGVVAHNCNDGHLFYHTTPAGDITANFTNLGLAQEYATNLTVIINQGATPYEITAIQIEGSAQTINWQGGSAPTGNANGIDSFSFTVLNDGGSYVVMGQMVDFT